MAQIESFDVISKSLMRSALEMQKASVELKENQSIDERKETLLALSHLCMAMSVALKSIEGILPKQEEGT